MLPFEPATTHIIAAPSGAGKSYYAFRILKHRQVMFGNEPPVKIRYYFGIYQPLFDEIKAEIPGIEFVPGLPSEQELMDFTDPKHHTLICIDDEMSAASKSDVVELIFTRIARHRRMSCLFLIQNLYCQGPKMRNINLNTKYITVLRSARDARQISILGSQLFPLTPKALPEAYNECMKMGKFPYLVIDLTSHIRNEYRLRTLVFPSEGTKIFIPI